MSRTVVWKINWDIVLRLRSDWGLRSSRDGYTYSWDIVLKLRSNWGLRSSKDGYTYSWDIVLRLRSQWGLRSSQDGYTYIFWAAAPFAPRRKLIVADVVISRVSCKKTWFLCSRSGSRRKLKCSSNVCPNGVFWTVEPFFSQTWNGSASSGLLGMVVQHHGYLEW